MAEPTSKPPTDLQHADALAGSPDANRSTIAAWWSAIAVVVVLIALAVGAYAIFRLDGWSRDAANGSPRFQLDLSAQMDVPPELLVYAEQRRLDIALHVPTAIASAPNGNIYIAGDTAIEVLRPNGTSATIALEDQPTCLAASGEQDANAGCVYVGVGGRIVVFDEAGERVQQWADGGPKSVLTSIALAGDSVFVADAGRRAVMHYHTDGELIGTIGQADPARQMPGFVIPSPYFDLVTGPDELLYVVNPGMRRVEAYSFSGELQSFWGHAGSALPDFFGCCNPAHIERFPDGRFVTSEKGIPRIKVYSADGDLQQVVAGPRQLGVNAAALGDARGDQKERVFDVALDAKGNVLVLDVHHRKVIVFELRVERSETES